MTTYGQEEWKLQKYSKDELIRMNLNQKRLVDRLLGNIAKLEKALAKCRDDQTLGLGEK